jgi:hypothetical protein
MRYTIDIDENGFTAYRGGPSSKPRKSECIATSRIGSDLDKLFAEIKQQGISPQEQTANASGT